MTRVLVAYSTNAGSTEEVARFVGKALGQDGPSGPSVDVVAIKAVTDVGAYDAVVVGGPMSVGWDREARRFLRDNQPVLRRVPVALFLTALSLTLTPEAGSRAVPVFVDRSLGKPARRAGKLSIHEGFTTVGAYLNPVLNEAPEVVPVGVAFFGGKLDYAKLSLPKRLFVRVVIRATAGDFRNWDAIRSWVSELRPSLLNTARAALEAVP